MYRSLDELCLKDKELLVEAIVQKKSGLIDKDWSEICEEFELDMSAETIRKAGVGVKLVADAHMLGGEKQDISEGYIERQKLRDLSGKVKALYRTEARSELLRETIREVAKEMPKFQIPPCTTKRSGGKTLVVTLGDFHYGAKICVRGLMGEVINEYDHKIFECRMTDLFHEIVNILEKEEIDHITLFLVGDLLDGMLRQSQLMRLEFGVIESTMRLSEYLSAWVNELSEHAEIDVCAVTGNHSEVRPLKSKCREFEDENLEKVIMWFMEERLSNNPHVSVNFQCNKFLYTEVQGFSFLLLHGDGERAISQISKDTINMYSKKIDFFVCGHKHREEEISSGMTSDGNSVIIRTPSLCGVDSYAQSKGYCGKPGAIATVIERGYGRRCVYPIIL